MSGLVWLHVAQKKFGENDLIATYSKRLLPAASNSYPWCYQYIMLGIIANCGHHRLKAAILKRNCWTILLSICFDCTVITVCKNSINTNGIDRYIYETWITIATVILIPRCWFKFSSCDSNLFSFVVLTYHGENFVEHWIAPNGALFERVWCAMRWRRIWKPCEVSLYYKAKEMAKLLKYLKKNDKRKQWKRKVLKSNLFAFHKR